MKKDMGFETDQRIEPVMGSVERVVDEDEVFRQTPRGHLEADSEHEDGEANGADFDAGDFLRDVIRLGGNGF